MVDRGDTRAFQISRIMKNVRLEKHGLGTADIVTALLESSGVTAIMQCARDVERTAEDST